MFRLYVGYHQFQVGLELIHFRGRCSGLTPLMNVDRIVLAYTVSLEQKCYTRHFADTQIG